MLQLAQLLAVLRLHIERLDNPSCSNRALPRLLCSMQEGTATTDAPSVLLIAHMG